MATEQLDDDFGKLMLYNQGFRTPTCPLDGTDLARLRGSQYLTLSSTSDPDYGPGDEITFQGVEQVSFQITGGDCVVFIGHRFRPVPRISFLPINDRVLHYCEHKDLGHVEKRAIKAFTRFLRNNNVLLEGQFACLQSLRTGITQDNAQCRIQADRPVPLHVPSMSRNWCADEIGILAQERDEGRRLYHFHPRGYDDKENIHDRYIYAGGDSQTPEPRPRLETIDPERLMRHAFIIKCLAVEWLKLLKAVASHTYVVPQLSRLERIVQIWENAIEFAEARCDHAQHAVEIKRLFAELKRIEYDLNYSVCLYKGRAGLEYRVILEATLSLFLDPDGRFRISISGGDVVGVGIAACRFERKLIVGPSFDLEASIRYAYGWKTSKRITFASKRGKTLHDVSRLLGLSNVNELKPYLQGMNCKSYVAGGCFVFRKEMEQGHDVPDAKAFHFKVKELLGYIYSNRLSRQFVGLQPAAEVLIDGDTIYYQRVPPTPHTWRDDPRLTTDCLEKYVGGVGYDPRRIGSTRERDTSTNSQDL